eukprot:12320-Heterococcus_DN1.PRE.13
MGVLFASWRPLASSITTSTCVCLCVCMLNTYTGVMTASKESNARNVDVNYDDNDDDIDVSAERARMQNTSALANNDVLQIHGLRKVYTTSSSNGGTKVAVHGTWLGVKQGECVGLLGPNGSGKTSTITTLCGEQAPTQGTASIADAHARVPYKPAGVNIVDNPKAVSTLIGYCPQYDPLYEGLTAREHLQLYARIKGIAHDDIVYAVNEMLHDMELLKYADKVAGEYR